MERPGGSIDAERVSPQAYLIRERAAEYKHEYLDGRIRAMSGATRAHNLIVINLARELSVQLKSRPCEVYASDMRVHVRRTGLYAYPDLAVVCGAPELEDEWKDTLLNPTLLVEVLSPATERFDREVKTVEHYRRLDSLAAYLLVAQDAPAIERWARGEDGVWTRNVVRGLDATLALPAIGCSASLGEVYDRVL
ncbi:MAG TPA: Uma2 family endonuclease [Longimicrobiales bacterium]